MTIRGIGVDLVEITRIERLLVRHGRRAVERILHPVEQAAIVRVDHPARFLAKRFAAKEAASKALGTGIAHGVRLQDIWIENDALGRPELVLAGGALQRARRLGALSWHVSLSDERTHVVAFVVLEGGGSPTETAID